jgi:hypothetical protein
MTKRTILATSMLALATMCSPALASNFSNVSLKPAHPSLTQQRMYPTSVLNPPSASYPTSVLNPPSLSYPTSILNR